MTLRKLLASLAMLAAPLVSAQAPQPLRLNQIQVIGSHNSYHAGLTPGVKTLLAKANPKALRALDYSHPSLTTQLDNGVRQLEIDVYADSKGGLYANLAATAMLQQAGLPADPPYNADGRMNRPGFKVMHVVGIDQRSTCTLFTDCLREVRTWVKAHPSGIPVFLLIEAKQDATKLAGTPTPEPFTPAAFDALDAEIRSVFQPGELITPDDLRGTGATLPDAIHTHGWPTLDSARGKVVFLLDNRIFTPMYSEGHPALRGRVLFTNSPAGTPESAFIEQNNGTAAEIDALVKAGELVRTRTDEGTEQARTNDTTRRDLALHTGAQLISTDYPPGEKSPWTDYIVTLPDHQTARCNPINAPATCTGAALAP